MSPLPAILALGNARVHISTLYSSNMTSYIKASIDQGLGKSTTLEISYIDPDYGYIRFWWYFDYSQFWSNMDVVEDVSAFYD